MLSSLVLFMLMFTLGQSLSYTAQEVLGYITIVLALLFIFFSIRHFKTNVNDNRLTFLQGFQIGIAISIFVAIGTSIADYIYTAFLYPNFVNDYAAHQLKEMKTSLSAEEFKVASAEMQAHITQYGSSSMMAMVMFVTVLILGFIITLLSSFMLYNKQTD